MRKHSLALLLLILTGATRLPGQICFQAGPSFDSLMLCNATVFVAADFNNDGNEDVAYKGYWVNTVTFQTTYVSAILHGDGAGGFTPGAGLLSNFSDYTSDIATGDFNEDGFPDLVVSHMTGKLVVFINDGMGQFTANALVQNGPSLPQLDVSDYDSDGHLDIAVGAISMTVIGKVFWGDGAGAFTSTDLLASNSGSSYATTAGDFNNDGLRDLAFGGILCLNVGSQAFSFSSVGFGGGLVEDFDSDGDLDVCNGVNIYPGSGFGTFGPAVLTNLSPEPSAVYDISDFNQDGFPDLCATRSFQNSDPDSLLVYLGNGNNTFLPAQVVDTMSRPAVGLYAHDMDGNGTPDLVYSEDALVFELCMTKLVVYFNGAAHITASAPALCQGDSLQLSATIITGGQYAWSTGDTIASIYVNAPGTYSVTVADTGNCSSNASFTVNAVTSTTFFPLSGTNNFCLYASPITLQTGTPSGGTYSGPGVSNGSFDPQAAGVGTHTLYYTYAGPGSCTGVDSQQVTVDICIGVTETENAEVKIYPNPASSALVIEWGGGKVSLHNAIGELVVEKSAAGNREEIDVSNLPEGIYFLRMEKAGETIARKIIIAR